VVDARLVVAGLVVLAGAGIAVAGASPQTTLSPSQARGADPGPVAVRGTVAEVDRQAGTLVLEDEDARLEATYDGVLPNNVEPGQTIVAEGTLDPGDPPRLAADEVQVGCPSSYEG
jgi:cytochrome c-type biogenesis protein CcmE